MEFVDRNLTAEVVQNHICWGCNSTLWFPRTSVYEQSVSHWIHLPTDKCVLCEGLSVKYSQQWPPVAACTCLLHPSWHLWHNKTGLEVRDRRLNRWDQFDLETTVISFSMAWVHFSCLYKCKSYLLSKKSWSTLSPTPATCEWGMIGNTRDYT